MKKMFLWLIFGVALGIATRFDLEITTTLANTSSSFGIFFSYFGEMPFFYVGIFSALVMLKTYKRQHRWIDWFHHAFFGSLSCGYILTVSYYHYVHFNLHISMIPIFSLVYLFVFSFIVSRVTTFYNFELRQAAKVGILLTLLSMFGVNVIKIFWGRMRYRAMDDPTMQFTPWYLPQGLALNGTMKSFPSGHAANSTTILWITLIPLFTPSLKNLKGFLYSMSVGWIACVMVSRLIMGAHFLSDVLMGSLLTILLFKLLRYHFIYQKHLD